MVRMLKNQFHPKITCGLYNIRHPNLHEKEWETELKFTVKPIIKGIMHKIPQLKGIIVESTGITSICINNTQLP